MKMTNSFCFTAFAFLASQEQAGKRMKLQIPETWETQLSSKGNKSNTWQELLGKLYL